MPTPPDATGLEIRGAPRGGARPWRIGPHEITTVERSPLSRVTHERDDATGLLPGPRGASASRGATVIEWHERFVFVVEHDERTRTEASCRLEAEIVIRRATLGVLDRDRTLRLTCRIGGNGDLQLEAWIDGAGETDAATARARLVGAWGRVPLATPFGHAPFEAWVGFDGRGDPMVSLRPRRRGRLWVGPDVPARDQRALVVASAALVLARPTARRILGEPAHDDGPAALD